MLSKILLRRIFSLVRRAQPSHRLRVTYADGSSDDCWNGGGKPEIEIRFRNRRGERRAAYQFYAGLFDAYIDGDIDIGGEAAITKLARVGHEVLNWRRGSSGGQLLTRNPVVLAKQIWLERRYSGRELAQARRNAISHYSHDPRFFRYLLGETVGYSEGYWRSGTTTLNQAKFNNYDLIARKLRLEPGVRVVSVGDGWGYMPILMADRYGAKVTAYNPVPVQNEYMRARFERHGLADRIRIVDGGHREIAQEAGSYDRYVSIGVFEHAGIDGYDLWLGSIAAALRPGGIGVISTTAKMFHAMTEYLTLKYVFPGGHLPSLPRILETMDRHGLNLDDDECLWPHYQRTVKCWLDNLERHWPEIEALDPDTFDERFRRIWTMYLGGTIEAFRDGLDLHHLVFTKGRDSSYYPLPLELQAGSSDDQDFKIYE
jgi:cyclopropane-fatty-acyl-phospholipid synthase